jgi:hypothetical protein
MKAKIIAALGLGLALINATRADRSRLLTL